MNRHTRAAWWRLLDRIDPYLPALCGAGWGALLAAVLVYGPSILWR